LGEVPVRAVGVERLTTMARDKAYYEAEKKIEEARRSGAMTDPSPASPKGEAPKTGQQMIYPTSYHHSTDSSPFRGKLEGGNSHGA